MFYPGEATTLRDTVRRLLDAAPARPTHESWPKALIVPHAGYVYSGATAAQAFAQLAPARGIVRRVVLLGPVHRVPVRGLALPGASAFRTPLGEVPLDEEGARAIASLPQVVTSAPAHAHEHSLEVQLPFLQEVLGDVFALLPLAVGDATPQEVAQVLDAVWGGRETLIVISSDLSHYLTYANAQQVDRATVDAMLSGRATLNHRQACGATPVNGLLLAAGKRGLASRLVKLCNSGDTAGDRDRVVGYASLAFDDAPDGGDAKAAAPRAGEVPDDAGAILLPIARAAIAQAIGVAAGAPEGAAWLQRQGATFVTLTMKGALRGCIGTLEAHRTLLDDVRHNAVAAALHDPRFPPLKAGEWPDLGVEVSLLSPPAPMPVRSEADALAQMRPGIDGIVLRAGTRRATFLPQVWEQLPDPRRFLAHLKAKAGLPPDFWSPDVRMERYTVRKWREEKAEGGE